MSYTFTLQKWREELVMVIMEDMTSYGMFYAYIPEEVQLSTNTIGISYTVIVTPPKQMASMIFDLCEINPISLGNKAKCKGPTPNPMPCTKEEGKTQMSFANANTVNVADTAVVDQRRYLENRASSIYSNIYRPLPSMFNINAPKNPRDFNTLMAAIKAGEYKLNDKLIAAQAKAAKAGKCWFMFEDEDGGCDDYHVSDPFLGVEFTNLPKPDKAGFDAAEKALKAAYTRVQDAVKIADPKDALVAVQEFETWTYTPPAA